MSPKNTIAYLKENGYRVCIRHLRPVEETKGSFTKLERITFGFTVKPKGGSTLVSIFDIRNPNFIIGIGFADCSERDSFNKRLGSTIALGRAVKAAGFSRQIKPRN